jgi:hypothetical protein
MQVSAAPAAQNATPTPAPKATPVVNTTAPTVPYLKDWQGSGHAGESGSVQALGSGRSAGSPRLLRQVPRLRRLPGLPRR